MGPRNNVVPFLRYSLSNGATAARHHLAGGVVFEEIFGQSQDVIGIAGAWARPSDPKFRDEFSIEAFYRFFLTPYTAIAPDIQFISNPSKTLDYNKVLIGSIRVRTVF